MRRLAAIEREVHDPLLIHHLGNRILLRLHQAGVGGYLNPFRHCTHFHGDVDLDVVVDPQNNAALRGRLKPGDRGLQCVCANRQAREVVDAIRVGDRIVDRAGIHTGHPELSAGYEGALPVYHTTRHRSNGNCLRM